MLVTRYYSLQKHDSHIWTIPKYLFKKKQLKKQHLKEKAVPSLTTLLNKQNFKM